MQPRQKFVPSSDGILSEVIGNALVGWARQRADAYQYDLAWPVDPARLPASAGRLNRAAACKLAYDDAVEALAFLATRIEGEVK